MRPAPLTVPRAREKWTALVTHHHWRCPIWRASGRPEGRDAAPDEIHHRLANTEPNRGRFPRLIHSLLNLSPVNHRLHMAKPRWGAPSLLDAERMERTLARWPRACAFVNGKTEELGWRR